MLIFNGILFYSDDKKEKTHMKNHLLDGKKVLITAGPTREPIDTVRYFSNQMEGTLGYNLASSMLDLGARVFLVSGPVRVDINHPSLTVVKVNTACEMYMACCRFFEEADIVVFAAAVSDYRPKELLCSKIENNEETLTIKMIKNIDVAGAFAHVKGRKITVGITAGENDNIQKAMDKLTNKNFDLIILNSIPADAARNMNNVSIIKNDYSVQPITPLKSKKEKIKEITEAIAFAWQEKQGDGMLVPINRNHAGSQNSMQA
jgi:phosphopantothenoylcysteine decarboxylase/phosphopantothenate--cysteine ligase